MVDGHFTNTFNYWEITSLYNQFVPGTVHQITPIGLLLFPKIIGMKLAFD